MIKVIAPKKQTFQIYLNILETGTKLADAHFQDIIAFRKQAGSKDLDGEEGNDLREGILKYHLNNLLQIFSVNHK
ncbi:hypothetical protein FJZ18_01745 [Candidatus Pacearchaeota archaeon]|nr:hypothetical protein [Candidatus Pacearchaeota archaeon]